MAWLTGLAPATGAGTPTELQSLSFSWSGGLLRGTQVKYVDVSLHLVDPDGITGLVATYLYNTSNPAGELGQRGVELHLVSGTTFDGTWSGRFAIGASNAGIWTAQALYAGDFISPDHGFGERPVPVPEPWNRVTMNVRGYDAPQAWLGTPVKTAGGYVIRGGVSLSRSQSPVVGLRVELLAFWDSGDIPVGSNCPFRIAARTDEIGHFAYTVPSLVYTYGQGHAVWRIYPASACTSILIQSNARSYI